MCVSLGFLSLAACWPCFQMKRTQRLKTALFMVDASAPSNMREATGPVTFIYHVRPTHHTAAGNYFILIDLTDLLSLSSAHQTILRRSSWSCWRICSRLPVPMERFWPCRRSSTSACLRRWCSDTTGSNPSPRAWRQVWCTARGKLKYPYNEGNSYLIGFVHLFSA